MDCDKHHHQTLGFFSLLNQRFSGIYEKYETFYAEDEAKKNSQKKGKGKVSRKISNTPYTRLKNDLPKRKSRCGNEEAKMERVSIQRVSRKEKNLSIAKPSKKNCLEMEEKSSTFKSTNENKRKRKQSPLKSISNANIQDITEMEEKLSLLKSTKENNRKRKQSPLKSISNAIIQDIPEIEEKLSSLKSTKENNRKRKQSNLKSILNVNIQNIPEMEEKSSLLKSTKENSRNRMQSPLKSISNANIQNIPQNEEKSSSLKSKKENSRKRIQSPLKSISNATIHEVTKTKSTNSKQITSTQEMLERPLKSLAESKKNVKTSDVVEKSKDIMAISSHCSVSSAAKGLFKSNHIEDFVIVSPYSIAKFDPLLPNEGLLLCLTKDFKLKLISGPEYMRLKNKVNLSLLPGDTVSDQQLSLIENKIQSPADSINKCGQPSLKPLSCKSVEENLNPQANTDNQDCIRNDFETTNKDYENKDHEITYKDHESTNKDLNFTKRQRLESTGDSDNFIKPPKQMKKLVKPQLKKRIQEIEQSSVKSKKDSVNVAPVIGKSPIKEKLFLQIPHLIMDSQDSLRNYHNNINKDSQHLPRCSMESDNDIFIGLPKKIKNNVMKSHQSPLKILTIQERNQNSINLKKDSVKILSNKLSIRQKSFLQTPPQSIIDNQYCARKNGHENTNIDSKRRRLESDMDLDIFMDPSKNNNKVGMKRLSHLLKNTTTEEMIPNITAKKNTLKGLISKSSLKENNTKVTFPKSSADNVAMTETKKTKEYNNKFDEDVLVIHVKKYKHKKISNCDSINNLSKSIRPNSSDSTSLENKVHHRLISNPVKPFTWLNKFDTTNTVNSVDQLSLCVPPFNHENNFTKNTSSHFHSTASNYDARWGPLDSKNMHTNVYSTSNKNQDRMFMNASAIPNKPLPFKNKCQSKFSSCSHAGISNLDAGLYEDDIFIKPLPFHKNKTVSGSEPKQHSIVQEESKCNFTLMEIQPESNLTLINKSSFRSFINETNTSNFNSKYVNRERSKTLSSNNSHKSFLSDSAMESKKTSDISDDDMDLFCSSKCLPEMTCTSNSKGPKMFASDNNINKRKKLDLPCNNSHNNDTQKSRIEKSNSINSLIKLINFNKK